MKTQNKFKIYVAMSGGVDSSVAAALLKKRGFEIVGVFFKPWSPAGANSGFCPWKQDRQDALRVCAKLGIPFKTWDFSKEYGKQVVKYMIDSYRAGITPNPDVMCNKEIKFGLFLKKALAEGADYIATGHYVRGVAGNNGHPGLRVGIDGNKDQSYFLWTLTRKQLKRCLFPIGNHTKPEVRKMAKKFGLPNHDKKDSQGVCFIGQLDMKWFLKNRIRPKAGQIRLADTGKVIGKHDGVYYYTVGQRHGLDIKDGHGPYFVAGKDIKKNIIYVAQGEDSRQLVTKDGKIKNVNWINGEPRLPLNCQVKIRYRTATTSAKIIKNGGNKTLFIKFKKPVRALTSGQSAVIYRGEAVLGGGVIF